jgi:hypothetical protein
MAAPYHHEQPLLLCSKQTSVPHQKALAQAQRLWNASNLSILFAVSHSDFSQKFPKQVVERQKLCIGIYFHISTNFFVIHSRHPQYSAS